MPVKIPDTLPATGILESENIFVMGENRALRQRQDTLTSERANLLQKNEQVRARVEAMIGRMKSMEQA